MSRTALPLLSNRFPVQPIVAARRALALPLKRRVRRNSLSLNAPFSQNPTRTENTSATRSEPFCCCCSPHRSTAVPPRCEPHPARACPRPEYQIVCQRPSAYPTPSLRHPTTPKSHIPDRPCIPCARCL